MIFYDKLTALAPEVALPKEMVLSVLVSQWAILLLVVPELLDRT